jgi:glycogen operon protein
MYLNGHGIAGLDATGNPLVDDHFLLYFNAGADDVQVTLPPEEFSEAWDAVIDTAAAQVTHDPVPAGATFELPGRSLVVLREYLEPEDEPDYSVAASLVAMAEPASEKPGRGKK